MSDLQPPRVSYAVPPGGHLDINRVTNERTAWIPLWVYWLQLAHRHAEAAETANRADHPTGVAVARQAHAVGPMSDRTGNLEMVEAMVAITSAANSIDAVFGSLQQVDRWKPPGGRKSGAKRSGEILEQLKQSFEVGGLAQGWSEGLDWLFTLRHDIVHHGEKRRPMVITAADELDIVLSAFEAYSLTAASARRAVDLVDRIISACLECPRPQVVEWAKRASLVKRNFGKMPGPSGTHPTVQVTQVDEDTFHISIDVQEPPEKSGPA